MRIGLLLAGVNPDNASLEDATDICWMMVHTKRLLHPSQWVDSLIEKRLDQEAEMLNIQINHLFG